MGFIDWALSKFGYAKLNKEAVTAGITEREFGVLPAASRKMEDNISLWYAMYINHPPWETCDVRPLGLPGAIGRELSRHVLTEFGVTVSGSGRADFLNQQIQTAATKFCINLEMGLCLGGVALKPYPDDRGRILVKAYTTGFTPTRFDGMGKCIGGVFKDPPVRQGKDWYVKLEYHDFLHQADGSEIYVVEHKAFRSNRDGTIGASVPLDTVDRWRDVAERAEIVGLDGPLFAYFIPPMANQEEPDSPLGVSVYSGSVALRIREADEQWERIWWEFKSGERKIFSDGTRIDAGQISDRLFLNGAFTSTGDLFEQFSPEFRNGELYAGLQYTLKIIEFNTGLAFGTISDPQSVNKTATEEIMTKHRQYVTEDAIQKAFQAALDDLIRAMDALCDLYPGLAPAGAYTVDYSWGDGVLDDPETRRQDMAMDIQRVNNLLMSREQFIMRWDKVDEDRAKEILAAIDRSGENDVGQDEVE